MGRIVHFTESQVNGIMERLNEDDLNVSYQKPATGTPSIPDMEQQIRNAKKSAPNANVHLDVSQADLNVMESKGGFTKKQLKEAKLKYLKENSVSYSKKEFTNKLLKK